MKQHHRAKLTADQVRAMRSRYVPGKVGYETLAAEFGCGISTARDICNYRTRRDVPDEPTTSTTTTKG